MAKLIYRGNSYQLDSHSLTKEVKPISLSYRGVKFEYQPQASVSQNQNSQTMTKVIYRGQSANLAPEDVKVKYRGADYSMPLFSVLPINIDRGLKYRGATY